MRRRDTLELRRNASWLRLAHIRRHSGSSRQSELSLSNLFQDLYSRLTSAPSNSSDILLTGILMGMLEVIIIPYIITHITYTEIDWEAYMQEVGGFLEGKFDYTQLHGSTGPLVYPAGIKLGYRPEMMYEAANVNTSFVYIYCGLYYATNRGVDIRFAQYLFFIFYLINLFLVFRIYYKTQKCPPYILAFLSCTSYRIHSLFVLRLFNDPIAMMIFYLALNLMLDKYWYLGSFVFSLAVSVKMNILLFAPGLLVLFLIELGINETILNLVICAATQVVLALPFLKVNPVGYIVRSFDLGRQFFHKWTVNWRFLPEHIFLDRRFHLALLALHILVLLAFASKKWKKNFMGLKKLFNIQKRWNEGEVSLSASQIVLVLFTSNFIGICFSRSLHYQFYVWYYHTIPYLLWSTSLSSPLRLLIFGLIELCWNTYPSTNSSSLCLHVCHLIILFGLWNQPGTAIGPIGPAAKLDDDSNPVKAVKSTKLVHFTQKS